MKELYKLNRTIYVDEDGYLTDEHWINAENKNIDKLFAKKGEKFNRIEITDDNYEELFDDYMIDDSCQAIYVSPTTGKYFACFDKNDKWFDKIGE